MHAYCGIALSVKTNETMDDVREAIFLGQCAMPNCAHARAYIWSALFMMMEG